MTMRDLFNSLFSVIIFTLVFIVSLFVLPSHILSGTYFWLGVVFVLLFSLNMTCLANTMRMRANMARAKGAGAVGVMATAVGFTALQMCGIGGPLCGALFGGVLFVSVLPAGAMPYLTSYAVHIVVIAILIQAVSLWYMKCFRK